MAELDINNIYFTHSEFKEVLLEYGKAIHSGEYKVKVPYECYRRFMKECVKGVRLVEDAQSNYYFYDDDEAKYIEAQEYFAESPRGAKAARIIITPMEPLIMVMVPTHEFCDFLRNHYLVYRPDWYTPRKEEKKEENKDMRLDSNVTECTLTWDNNGSKSTSGLAYDSSANKEYDCVWTTTTPNVTWNGAADTWTTVLDSTEISKTLQELAGAAQSTAGAIGGIGKEIKKLNDKNEKENKKMKGLNFDFGPCTTDNVRMSMYGIAIKNQAGEWVSYNPATAQIVNVDIFNFEGGKYMFKMPVAPKDVVAGDVIVHNKKAMIVLDKDENGFVVVDPHAGEEKKVVPTSNCFGFNFITKIISMLDGFAAAPDADAPFGNMLPFMLMADGNKDIDPMMMMFMMNQNGNMGDMFSNPMMLYFLCGDKMNKDSMLPLMFMMNANKPVKGKSGK